MPSEYHFVLEADPSLLSLVELYLDAGYFMEEDYCYKEVFSRIEGNKLYFWAVSILNHNSMEVIINGLKRDYGVEVVKGYIMGSDLREQWCNGAYEWAGVKYGQFYPYGQMIN